MKIKCIYCLKEWPTSEYIKREHVIPRLFGTFFPINLILSKTVCDSCNAYFGDNLELFLGRDTYEGLLRYQYGIRSKKLNQKYSRLKLKISSGPLKGMLVKPKYSDLPGKIDINQEQILQVGFLKKGTYQYDYFEPQNIPTSEELEGNGYDLKENNSVRIVANDRNEIKYLIDLLRSKGIESSQLEDRKWKEYQIEKGDIPVEIDAKIDRTIHRGLSKIAFNYLSYIAGNSFVLSDNFNDIRDFIRFDIGDSKDFMIPNVSPILHDDQRFNIKTVEGHLITVGWKGGDILFSKLSIFNETTWEIKLCNNFKGIWRPINKGHFFDIHSKKVIELKNLILRY
jgi:hypothetical protein